MIDARMERGSGNVFADLDVADADERQTKTQSSLNAWPVLILHYIETGGNTRDSKFVEP